MKRKNKSFKVRLAATASLAGALVLAVVVVGAHAAEPGGAVTQATPRVNLQVSKTTTDTTGTADTSRSASPTDTTPSVVPTETTPSVVPTETTVTAESTQSAGTSETSSPTLVNSQNNPTSGGSSSSNGGGTGSASRETLPFTGGDADAFVVTGLAMIGVGLGALLHRPALRLLHRASPQA